MHACLWRQAVNTPGNPARGLLQPPPPVRLGVQVRRLRRATLVSWLHNMLLPLLLH
jgi:hypothetical protein